MHLGVLQALEFGQIVDAVRGFALTPLGRARLAGLRPMTDPRRVAQALATTSEAVRYLAQSPAFPLEAPSDLESILAALAVEARPLEPLRLLGLARFLESVGQACDAIRQTGGTFPLLQALTEPAASFQAEAADVRDKIDPAGEVLDQASPALRSIRDRLRKARARLRGTLESYLRGKDTSRYLQDQIVTDRNGRYVLVVRSEHRTAIPGIIHGTSASGASLYLEPLSTVELNNEIVALEEDETEEVRRILLALTDRFRGRALDLQRTIETGTELDGVQARARFSQLVGGSEPVLVPDGSLELRSARHPLLIAAVAERLDSRQTGRAAGPGEARDGGAAEPNAPAIGRPVPASRPRSEPVPIDILLDPPASVLLITGPNTGGKTVALKTAGLLALMAQAGLHVPAAPGSRLPVFRSVFADIGDEQSIAASLSTFSWHITNVASMDDALALPALVLLDEVGAGTDPAEGGALGVGIIEHFRRRSALVIATTHHDALKAYASATPGVIVAAFGFHPDTFEPTYRLVYGSPGRSLALEIAGRLGLNSAILALARANMTDREAQLAEHLTRIDRDLNALDHERRLVARERESIGDEQTRLREREEALRQREDGFKRRLDDQINDRLREARREIDDIVDDLKRRAAVLKAREASRSAPGFSTGEAGALRSEARAALEQTAARLLPQPAATSTPSGARPAPGDRVTVGPLGIEGILAQLHDGEVEVDVLGKRLRARLEEVRLVARGGAPDPPRVNVNVQLQHHEDVQTDLNVIGCTVDEALTRASRFLDEMLLTDHRTVRLIHGYGTGQLRRAIAEFLHNHPLVASFTAAPSEQGGGGVTVVELKE